MEGYKRKLWALFAIPLLLEPVCYTLYAYYAIPYMLYPILQLVFTIPYCFTLDCYDSLLYLFGQSLIILDAIP